MLTGLGPVTVKFTVQVEQQIRSGHHGIALFNNDQQLIWARDSGHLDLDVGEHSLCHSFWLLPLKPGPYFWHVSLYDMHEMLDLWECLPEMIVATENYQHPSDEWNGVLNIPSQFVILQNSDNPHG